MPKIHHVQIREEERWTFDEDHGPRRERLKIPEPSDTNRIVHQGQTYEVQPDGTFEVPEDLAAFMTRTPGWGRGLSPIPPPQPEQPRRAPARAKKE